MNPQYKSLDGQLHSEPHWSFVNSYGLSKCFFSPFIKKPFRLIQLTTVQRFFVFGKVLRKLLFGSKLSSFLYLETAIPMLKRQILFLLRISLVFGHSNSIAFFTMFRCLELLNCVKA